VVRLPAVLILSLCLAAAACGGSGPEKIPDSALPRLVLHPSDLSRVFVRFVEGRQLRADAPGGSRADPARFGRKDGWIARYRRSGSTTTRGPLVVESRADLFSSAGGAKQELEAIRAEYEASARATRPPELGDAAAGFTFRRGNVVFYLVAWRDRNVTASVVADGFAGRLRLSDVAALARKQARRIAAVA
jgi:hypothetical protein